MISEKIQRRGGEASRGEGEVGDLPFAVKRTSTSSDIVNIDLEITNK